MTNERWLWHGLVACLLAVACSATPVAAESLQFDAPVASFCIGGAFPVTVTVGGATLPGMLVMVAGDAAAVTGTLEIGAETFTLTGKQKAKKGILNVALKGASATGAKVTLKGAAAGAHLVGAISGKVGGAKLAAKSTFDADLTGAPPFAVRCELDVIIDPTSGAVAGSGLAQVCGGFDGVTLTGSTNLPKAAAKGKEATGKLKIAGSIFTWSGKGVLIQSADGSLGFVVTWKGKGLGVSGSGANLRFATVVDGPSPGQIALPESIATRFNPLTLQNVVLTVSDATPSTSPLDYAFTQNGDPISPGLMIDAQQGTLTLAELDLFDGRNDIAVVGKDVAGLTLSGVVTIWAGAQDLVVSVRDSLDHPVTGAAVELRLGDDQRVMGTGTSDANGDASFSDITNRTVLVYATGPPGASGIASGLGNAGTIVVAFRGFDAPSAIDNNDFATGDASGWNIGPTATIVPHVEDVGPQALGSRAPPFGSDVDLSLATLGEGTQTLSRTFATKPNTVAVKVRYRFITEEIPGGYFGTKYNDAFSVSVRTQNGGGEQSDVNTMNGLGLAAFDASGATDWKEIILPVTSTGDLVQVDVTVANVADEFFDSAVIVDKVSEVTIDLLVANASRLLLETNRFEITVNPPGGASNFKIEISRAGTNAWFTLGTQQIVSDFKQRVAGKFKLRGRATVAGKEQITSEKDLEVQFPAFGDIIANGAVIAMTDAAFASTKAATTPTGRREEGFFILLDTNAGAEKYVKSPTVIGPVVKPLEQGAVDFDKPPDNPVAPTPIQAAAYVVASFHTHSPTVFRPVGRPVGPTPEDRDSDTNVDHDTGLVYDYVGVNGLAPAHHPLNSPARLYQSGPDRRPTPP